MEVVGTEVFRDDTIVVDKEVLSRLMKKGEAYSQIQQYLNSREGDAMVISKIRQLIKTTERMME